MKSKRGYFGIGIQNTKNELNIGTLWRSARIMGASLIFTIGKRYKRQASDTTNASKHIPLLHYDTFADFYRMLPHDCRLIGVELDNRSVPLQNFCHPERCIYLLGAEDHGLTREAIEKCHALVRLPGDICMNVSVAGSITMYDRIVKSN